MSVTVSLSYKERYEKFCVNHQKSDAWLIKECGVKIRSIQRMRAKYNKATLKKKADIKLTGRVPDVIKPELSLFFLKYLWTLNLPDDPKDITQRQMKMGLEIIDKEMRYKKQLEDEAREAVEEDELDMEMFMKRAKAITKSDPCETEEEIY